MIEAMLHLKAYGLNRSAWEERYARMASQK